MASVPLHHVHLATECSNGFPGYRALKWWNSQVSSTEKGQGPRFLLSRGEQLCSGPQHPLMLLGWNISLYGLLRYPGILGKALQIQRLETNTRVETEASREVVSRVRKCSRSCECISARQPSFIKELKGQDLVCSPVSSPVLRGRMPWSIYNGFQESFMRLT